MRSTCLFPSVSSASPALNSQTERQTYQRWRRAHPRLGGLRVFVQTTLPNRCSLVAGSWCWQQRGQYRLCLRDPCKACLPASSKAGCGAALWSMCRCPSALSSTCALTLFGPKTLVVLQTLQAAKPPSYKLIGAQQSVGPLNSPCITTADVSACHLDGSLDTPIRGLVRQALDHLHPLAAMPETAIFVAQVQQFSDVAQAAHQ